MVNSENTIACQLSTILESIDFLTLSGFFWNLQSVTAMSFKLKAMTLRKLLIGKIPLRNRWNPVQAG
ncbi:hypothetical protein RIF29_20529 [Crotalaria pallida]|uniref:Uncharacterized protein n=1 Tax=Crotalaria pallida TaxID=3830 RepID=A0AAN9I8S1_CROPI